MYKKDFVEATLEAMADTDWSRFSDLADASSGDLKAAAVALWMNGQRRPDTDAMISMLRRRYGSFSDYGALASAEKDTQIFMDKAEELKLGSFLLDQLNEAVAVAVARRYRSKGWIVVDLNSLEKEGPALADGEEGLYVFVGESD